MNLRFFCFLALIVIINPAKAEMNKSEELILAITLNQKLELIQRIVSEGANVNAVVRNDSPLMASIAVGRKDILEYLLNKGANPNKKVNSFMSPMSGAITFGNASFIELMLSYGADPDIYSGGFTPLLLAAKSCDVELVELFLINGANPKLKTKSGMTGAYLAKFNGLKKPEKDCKYVLAIFNEFS